MPVSVLCMLPFEVSGVLRDSDFLALRVGFHVLVANMVVYVD